MKEKGRILIMEPECIVWMDLKKELENKGYAVMLSNDIKLSNELKGNADIKIIIINIDKVKPEDFIYMKQKLTLSEISVIAISSSSKIIEEREGVQFTKTFMKPISCKDIIALVDNHFSIKDYI